MKSYQKILHLGDPMADRLLVGEVEIEEKVDGSMFRAEITPDGTISCGSKRVEFSVGGMDSNFGKGVEAIKKAFEGYKPSTIVTIFGEYLSSPKQNTLVYERTPTNHIMIFDVAMSALDKTVWLDYDNKKEFAKQYGFEVVPLLYRGDGINVNQELINKLLTNKSVLGNEIIEGVVVKNKHQYYDITKYPWLAGHWMAGKYVRKEFQERNSGEHAGEKSGVDGLKISYGGAGRWNKAIQHLRDEGKLQGNMKDMVLLLDEVKRDIIEEEKENIKEELWKIYSRQILGSAIKGLPEYYKQKLLENI